MKRAIIGLACLSVVIGIALATRIATQAGAIGAGYAAKQVCSGVFVARLPERFIVETDVLPRLATVAPLHHLLTYQLNGDERMVTARMLGQKMRVQHRSGYGCTVLRDDAAEVPSAPDRSALPPSDPSKSTAQLKPIKTGHPALRGALDRAFTEPPEGGRNTLAVIVRHHGEIVAERYRAPVTIHTPMQGWSMNKSLMATFIGQQIDRDRLSLDDSVTEALKTAGAEASLVSSVNPDLTLGHLLSMTSGFDFAERYFPGDDVTDMLYRQPGMWMSAPATRHARPPAR